MVCLSMRHYSRVDQIIFKFNDLFAAFPPVQTAQTPSSPLRPTPTPNPMESSSVPLTESERQHSIALMRINHSGEVCAQALYQGQALAARDKKLVEKLRKSAKEEEDHLHWCKTRLEELNGRPSFLNPVWKLGSLAIGGLAGLLGDRINLGFLAETEYQVTHHLDKHLKMLSKNDIKSRVIIEHMREDELQHATTAMAEGGILLPNFIRNIMRTTSKIMTSVARYI